MASSVILDLSYDDEAETLTVLLTTGRAYVYDGVPADVAAGFEAARSKGAYYNAEIRDRYRYREIDWPWGSG